MMRRGTGAGARSWWLKLFGIVIVSGMLAGCGGGSTPVSPTPPPTTMPVTPSFAGEDERPEQDSILLTMTASSSSSFTLVLSANNVSDLFGYGLDLVFDPAIIAFVSFEAGTFFDGQDVSVTTQVVESAPGRLVIGQSRVGAVPGVTGTGAMLLLNFTTVSAGSTPVTLEDAAAFDSTGEALVIRFLGGTVLVPIAGR